MKSNIILLAVTVSLSLTGLSQNTLTFDELISEIKNSTYSDSSKVYINGDLAIKMAKAENDLSKISLVYQNYGNYNFLLGKQKIAMAYFDTSIVYAKEGNDSTLIIASEIRKNFFNFNVKPKETELAFLNFIDISKRRGDTNNIALSLNGVALCNEIENKPNQALKHYLQAYDLAVASKDVYLQGMLLSNIGLIKFKNQQYDKALIDYQKAIKLSEEIGSIRLNFYLQNNIGLVYEKLGMLEESMVYFRRSLDRANEIGFPYSIGVTHLNLSGAYGKINEPNLSILHADSAFLIFKALNNFQNLAKPFIIKSEAYLIKENYEQALILVDSAIYYSRINSSLGDLLEAYKLKSKVYQKLNRFEEALEVYMYYANMRDSSEIVSNQKQFSELQVIYDTEKRETELKEERTRIAILEKDNKIYQSRVLIVIIIGVIILLAAAVIIYFRYIQIRRRRQVLFSHQLIKNIDDERSRISKDLHDDIGQSLSVAKSKINLFNKGQLDNIDDMESSLGDLIQQVRVLSHELHPSFLEKIGLKRSVISLLDKIEKDTQLITSHRLFDEIDDLELEVQNQLYRITQECINNTIKHADAKSIKVTIKTDRNNFIYIYRDNGKGLDAALKTGFGFSAMKERSSKIGGRFSVHSQIGKGIKIMIKFPKK